MGEQQESRRASLTVTIDRAVIERLRKVATTEARVMSRLVESAITAKLDHLEAFSALRDPKTLAVETERRR